MKFPFPVVMEYVKYTTSVFIYMHFPSLRNYVLRQPLLFKLDKNQELQSSQKFSEVLKNITNNQLVFLLLLIFLPAYKCPCKANWTP